MKKVILIAGSEETIKTLSNQIMEFFQANTIKINGYAIDQTKDFNLSCDVLILSSTLMYQELKDLMKIPKNLPLIIGKRTLNFDYLQQLISIRPGTNALLVNDLKITTLDIIDSLKTLGLDHIHYIPYYPGCPEKPLDATIAITPGEVKHIPKGISETINIGPRIFDFTTIAKILTFFDALENSSCIFSRLYLRKIINISKRLARSKNNTEKLKNDLKNILDGFKEGLLAFDADGYVTLLNNNLKLLLKIRHQKTENIHLRELIYNKKLLSYLLDPTCTTPYVLTLENKEIYVQKISSNNSNNTVVSFKYDHQLLIGTQNSKTLTKGHYAKYTFKDLVGKSPTFIKAKKIAQKLATSDITMLIEGESGTGKELFASSIHNHSHRSNEKFLAINFSALPDDLIESELFGYAEGAFTGAKKGGKKGLFEEADGGSIFLDEIGDVSLKVQTRLLRVLEEKEIMPIGSNKIVPINVRIIAATNKNLEKLVEKNKFRQDLYFRLKMGYIHLPKLSQRKNDIPLLVEHLIYQSSVDAIEISKEVVDFLKSYNWPGNIRELKNIITYMIAYSEDKCLTLEDLPQKYYFKNAVEKPHKKEASYTLDRNDIYILNCINDLLQSGIKPSRKKISLKSEADGFDLSINQVRRILNKLEDHDLILKKKGRYGTNITNKGLREIGG